jgi:hypothetical protein
MSLEMPIAQTLLAAGGPGKDKQENAQECEQPSTFLKRTVLVEVRAEGRSLPWNTLTDEVPPALPAATRSDHHCCDNCYWPHQRIQIHAGSRSCRHPAPSRHVGKRRSRRDPARTIPLSAPTPPAGSSGQTLNASNNKKSASILHTIIANYGRYKQSPTHTSHTAAPQETVTH